MPEMFKEQPGAILVEAGEHGREVGKKSSVTTFVLMSGMGSLCRAGAEECNDMTGA